MEKKKLQLNEFAIEITRKCNMKCAHCLRGEAQKRNIHKKYITKVLEDISSIGSLTITGGEPTLNMFQQKIMVRDVVCLIETIIH